MIYEIIIDHGETANKCTIAPLSARADFRIIRVRGEKPLGPLTAPILLHHEGECLTKIRQGLPVRALAGVDCVWRRLPTILRRLSWADREATRARIPDGFVTAYPRVSVHQPDPDGGLATIEAFFIASAVLGHWDVSLLDRYYFAPSFIERNADRFTSLGVKEAGDRRLWPVEKPFVRNSHSRKINRGQLR